jgi:peroxiredoxin (alkyl hydroperoxide reductase subunit C)
VPRRRARLEITKKSGARCLARRLLQGLRRRGDPAALSPPEEDPMLTVGYKLPAFTVGACVSTEKGKEFKDISNTDFAGKWLILYFYPKDFTFICPTEIVDFDKSQKDFAERDAVVVGGSTDNPFSHLAWRNSHADLKNITHPLIHLTPKLGAELGVIHPDQGVALRTTFIVDPQGVIRSAVAYDLDVGRNIKETLRTLDALQMDELCPCNWQKGEPTLGK